jgi:hypothetical protein
LSFEAGHQPRPEILPPKFRVFPEACRAVICVYCTITVRLPEDSVSDTPTNSSPHHRWTRWLPVPLATALVAAGLAVLSLTGAATVKRTTVNPANGLTVSNLTWQGQSQTSQNSVVDPMTVCDGQLQPLTAAEPYLVNPGHPSPYPFDPNHFSATPDPDWLTNQLTRLAMPPTQPAASSPTVVINGQKFLQPEYFTSPAPGLSYRLGADPIAGTFIEIRSTRHISGLYAWHGNLSEQSGSAVWADTGNAPVAALNTDYGNPGDVAIGLGQLLTSSPGYVSTSSYTGYIAWSQAIDRIGVCVTDPVSVTVDDTATSLSARADLGLLPGSTSNSQSSVSPYASATTRVSIQNTTSGPIIVDAPFATGFSGVAWSQGSPDQLQSGCSWYDPSSFLAAPTFGSSGPIGNPLQAQRLLLQAKATCTFFPKLTQLPGSAQNGLLTPAMHFTTYKTSWSAAFIGYAESGAAIGADASPYFSATGASGLVVVADQTDAALLPGAPTGNFRYFTIWHTDGTPTIDTTASSAVVGSDAADIDTTAANPFSGGVNGFSTCADYQTTHGGLSNLDSPDACIVPVRLNTTAYNPGYPGGGSPADRGTLDVTATDGSKPATPTLHWTVPTRALYPAESSPALFYGVAGSTVHRAVTFATTAPGNAILLTSSFSGWGAQYFSTQQPTSCVFAHPSDYTCVVDITLTVPADNPTPVYPAATLTVAYLDGQLVQRSTHIDLIRDDAANAAPPGTVDANSTTGTATNPPTAVSGLTPPGIPAAVTGIGGNGTVTSSQYPSGFSPAGGVPFTLGGTNPAVFDIRVSPGNTFTSVTIDAAAGCVPGDTLNWVDALGNFVPVQPPAVCDPITHDLLWTAYQDPPGGSSPTIAQLTGTVFAVAAAPAGASLVADSTSIPSGSSTNITVNVVDASNAAVPNAAVVLTPSNASAPVTGTTDVNGTATLPVSDTVVGPVTYAVTANRVDVGSITITYTAVSTGTAPVVSGTAGAGEVGVTYSAAFTATGDPTPTFTATGLPDGLSIDSTGNVTGTPTVGGTFNATITAANSAGTADYPVTFTIAAKLAITTTSLPDVAAASNYAQTVTNNGGIGTLTWSATGLPAGLSMNTAGVITGSTTTPGTSTVAVSVTDGLGATATTNLSLTVVPGAPASLSLTAPASPILINTNVTVKAAVTDSSGNPTPNVTVTLSYGLSSQTATTDSTGVATFTTASSTPGTVNYTATAGSTSGGASVTYGTTPTVSGTPGAGEVGVSYTTTFSATGSPTPTISAVGLPDNLSISSTGAVTGSPTVAGTFNATVTATNTLGHGDLPASFTIFDKLAITTSSLPSGTVNSAYSASVFLSGGGGLPQWSATGLPNGLTMSTAGVISGTTTSIGAFQVAITVTDGLGGSAAATFPVTVSAGAPAKGTVVANPTSVTVTTNSTVTVTVTDASGNPNAAALVTLAGSDATTATATTNATGVATFTVTSATAAPVTYTATVGTVTIGTATVTYAAAPPAGADVAIGLTQSTFSAGSDGAYRIKVTNTGTTTANGIKVVDTLPGGITYSNASGSGWKCTAVGQVVTCTYSGSVAAAKVSNQLTINVRVRAKANTVVSNTATVSFTGIDPTPADNTATVTQTVRRG